MANNTDNKLDNSSCMPCARCGERPERPDRYTCVCRKCGMRVHDRISGVDVWNATQDGIEKLLKADIQNRKSINEHGYRSVSLKRARTIAAKKYAAGVRESSHLGPSKIPEGERFCVGAPAYARWQLGIALGYGR